MRAKPVIAVDAMGGDDAPGHPVEGAVMAVRAGCEVRLVGHEDQLREELHRHRLAGDDAQRVVVVHAEEAVAMDDPPITPIRKKRKSSIRIAAQLVRDGEADALVSAGNTGAAMIAAKMVMGTVEGVDRPALAAALPNPKGHTVLLDVGANIDSKPEHLLQFAVMGSLFAQEVVKTSSPRVGLLSIGEEDSKGTELTREVFQALETSGLNFVGNVEGSDVFKGTADVIVCDGFVGNVVLKSAESLADMVMTLLKEELGRGFRARIGGLLARPAFVDFRRRTAYDEYGGAPLLGVKGGCFIAHGRATPKAMMSAILRATEYSEANVSSKISERLAERQSQEAALG
ncbi:MAG: phosphate acyltransferase PlsX [Acidobacteriota bacterium]